ncbi:MAG: holo-ACP synthase [Spirochaetales bacterium]|nr:holo-ACP synthase [Spirochaetales bacterium]
MILGIGIDIVHINRLERWRTHNGLIQRYFHPKEITDAESRGASMVQSLSARFAAKEAFGKALGTGLRGLKLQDIQVNNSHNGKPEIILHGEAHARFLRLGGKNLFVSLTHEKENAVAMVVIEGGTAE